jgi:hypothetical protein
LLYNGYAFNNTSAAFGACLAQGQARLKAAHWNDEAFGILSDWANAFLQWHHIGLIVLLQ